MARGLHRNNDDDSVEVFSEAVVLIDFHFDGHHLTDSWKVSTFFIHTLTRETPFHVM